MASIVWRFGTELFAVFVSGTDSGNFHGRCSGWLVRVFLSRHVLILPLLTLLDFVIVCVFLTSQGGHSHHYLLNLNSYKKKKKKEEQKNECILQQTI